MTSKPTPDSHYCITLLRHGESTANAEGIRQGQANFPLTELGKHQVRSLVARWKDEKVSFDQIISSPLARARQTCEIISTSLQIPAVYDDLWAERDNGVLAGLSIEEAAMRYPRPDFISLYEPIGEIGESQWELFVRASRAVHSLFQNPPGNYLVVSHGGLLNMVMYSILGVAPQADFRGVHFVYDNASFANLTYNLHSSRWRVLRLNDHSHIQSGVEDRINQPDSSFSHRFLLIRHGESQANAEKRLQGQSDYELTGRGIIQAQALSKSLKTHHYIIDKILTSPLKRAYDTAMIIKRELSVPLESDPLWMEQDFGILAGRTTEEIAKILPDPNFSDPYQATGYTGESRWELYLRASEGLLKILRHPPGTYIIVAHGGILNMLLCAATGITPQNNLPPPGFRFDNAGMAKLLYRPERHNWILSAVNERPFLQ